MTYTIRPFEAHDLDDLVVLSVAAWEPVFVAWEKILGPDLYPVAIYPDWRVGQADVVRGICCEEKNITWVGVVDDNVVGFVVYDLNHESQTGEVQLLAVHPAHQNDGLGTALNELALEKMSEAGMKLAVVGTGGDEGHAPARRSYEKAGYTGLPLVRYYRKLSRCTSDHET